MTLHSLQDEYRKKGLTETDVEVLTQLSHQNPATFQRLAQRRLFGEPFSYLAGHSTFYGRSFDVDRRVYVPNPETEHMVKLLLQMLRPGNTVVDVGTGCGAIAITIAKERSDVQVYAVDIDPSALAVARDNAHQHAVNVNFSESFYINDLNVPSVDFIISDLPYGNQHYTLDSIDLKEFEHMPPIALFHPHGALAAYTELIESIQRKAWTPTLFLETGKVGKRQVEAIIPDNVDWEYVKASGYSVTKLRFLD